MLVIIGSIHRCGPSNANHIFGEPAKTLLLFNVLCGLNYEGHHLAEEE